MAITRAGTELTRLHRARQAAIQARTLRVLAQAWPLLDVSRLDATAPGFVDAVTRIIAAGYELSAQEAVAYYDAFRRAEGVTGLYERVLPRPDLEAIRTSALVTGPVRVKQLIGQGLSPEAAMDRASTTFLSTGGYRTVAGGREAITATMAGDRRALGVARVAGPDACAFCAMLASRGPAYKSEEDWSAGFEAHVSCGCEPETVFSDGADYRWPENGERYRQLWDEIVGPVDQPGHVSAGSGSGRPGQLGRGDQVPLQVFRAELEARRAAQAG